MDRKLGVEAFKNMIVKGKLLGEPPEERNDDIRVRMKRAVRSDPLHAPDEPIVVNFLKWDDPQGANGEEMVLRRELATVGEAKDLLMEAYKLESSDVLLEIVYFGKRLVPDDALLCDCGVTPGSTCYVRTRARVVD